MTRKEILAIAKPILFNTKMVQAILNGRKSVTRRVVKPQPAGDGSKPVPLTTRPGYWNTWGDDNVYRQPYRPGDILYVRETWTIWGGDYEYKADVDDGYGPFCSNCTLDICTGGCNSVLKWRPSIHMPKEVARIFLRVTDVRVERLQSITEDEAIKEGCTAHGGNLALDDFEAVWHNTLKLDDRSLYGWDANPWVWVIEFEIVEAEK